MASESFKDFKAGDSLTNHPNIDFLVGNSMEDLVAQLKQIQMPFKIISSHTIGSRPAVIISLSRPIKKKTKDKIGE